MPKAVADFLGYSIFFFSNENGEPMHIHVSKGAPSKNSAKFWIKKDDLEMAHNNAKIPSKDLKKIKAYIVENRAEIVETWVDFFHFM